MKIDASGLESGTRYFYRFTTYQGELSPVGTFKTAPDAATAAPVHFGFSGDADGQWRPYPVTANFAQQDFDFFVFLGDTIYEGSNARSAGTANVDVVCEYRVGRRAVLHVGS